MQSPHSRIPASLLALLGGCIAGAALSAPPTATVPEQIATAVPARDGPALRMASRAKSKAAQARDGQTRARPSADAAKQPYRSLVDAVRKSTDAFGDENVSDSGERDRLQDPPPR